MYAFAGTVMSAIFIGCLTYAISQDESIWTMSFIDAMAMGSLISATDPGTFTRRFLLATRLLCCALARTLAALDRLLALRIADLAPLLSAAVSTISVFSKLGVNPMLYNLVFGESVVNDAVGIVLFSYARFLALDFIQASFSTAARSPVQRVQ